MRFLTQQGSASFGNHDGVGDDMIKPVLIRFSAISAIISALHSIPVLQRQYKSSATASIWLPSASRVSG